MARWYGSTAERGLGADHAADKKRLLALHRDGDPCWRCGQPMYKSQDLHRGHIIDRALGGANGPAALEHAACNLSAGARLGNQLQPRHIAAAGGRNVTCKTCGQPYHYAARTCEICGRHYHPSRQVQYTCSRPCGAEYRRRTHGWAGPAPPRPKPPRLEREPKRWPSSQIYTYTCRYCGKVAVEKATRGQRREVCPDRLCQLARLRANNLRTRNGLTKEEADAQMAAIVTTGSAPPIALGANGRWRSSRRW